MADKVLIFEANAATHQPGTRPMCRSLETRIVGDNHARQYRRSREQQSVLLMNYYRLSEQTALHRISSQQDDDVASWLDE